MTSLRLVVTHIHTDDKRVPVLTKQDGYVASGIFD
jgi:hypothetical protein